MRHRLHDSLSVAFKNIGKDTKITKQQIQSDDYINNCIESNMAFLRCMPNSAWYWSQRKKDLFAMIRQFGKPTIFLTLSANEVNWDWLIKTLYSLKNKGAVISDQGIADMHYIEKANLVNEDSVTCAINFNKLVNTMLNILQNKNLCPFGKYRVEHYFKRIEFQQRGSPHAHILLWLENDPVKPMEEGMQDAIQLIDSLISVDETQTSGNVAVQTHKHTFSCYKRFADTCRFDAPFLPVKKLLY